MGFCVQSDFSLTQKTPLYEILKQLMSNIYNGNLEKEYCHYWGYGVRKVKSYG